MNIKVLSKLDLQNKLFNKQIDKDVCIISIQDPSMFTEFKNENRCDIIYLRFYDIEEKIDKYNTISDNDVDRIIEFILSNINKDFIISCDAGISRSSGVAAAISNYFNGDDSEYFGNNSRYIPNMLCYRKVYEGLLNKKI